MKKIFSFIIRQKVTMILLVVFILAYGIFATLKMPINLLPDIHVPMVCVQVIYPGANAKSVETDVTVKLEDGLSSISGVTKVASYSYDNLSALVLSFDYGTDTKEKKSSISSKMSGISLPDDTTVSIYDIDLNAEALAVLSVTGNSGETDDAKLYSAYKAADEITAKLRAIDGVESVEIKGGPTTSYVIKPYGGLELISPLIVQAFSYGALDIPLGNLVDNGVNVQIRNNSDIVKEEDITGMPLTLPAPIVTLLSSVKRLMGYYEDSTEDDLVALRDDLSTGVLTVLGELDGYTSDQVNDFATLKTYMNIASSYTARQLRDFKRSPYYNRIYEAVTDPPATEGDPRVPKDDDELADIVEELKDNYPQYGQYITVDMLKVVRDGKIDVLIYYREHYIEDTAVNPAYNEDEYYKLTADDYYALETGITPGGLILINGDERGCVNVYSSLYDKDDPATITPEAETAVRNNIDFALKTSASGLAAIADKKRDAEEAGETEPYRPTDSECALLFAGTDLAQDHPIITSPTFIAFVRSDSYDANMALIISSRASCGDDVTPAEFFELYSALDLTGIFEFKLSEKLIGFIDDTEAGDLTGSSFVVNVGDIADIDKSDSFTSYVYFANGKLSIIKGTVIEVYKSNGANSSAVVDEVKKTYAAYLADGNPHDASVALLDDQSQFISDSIMNVLVSMLIGGALAVLVIFLFLRRVRTSLIVAVTMPLSVLAALICLSLMGISLNMVSLGGLAVGIGMLVDNSIVVIESISKHRDMGKSVFVSAVDGTCEVGGALIGSTVTTVCVFIPIIFSGGLTGEIFVDLSWSVIFSLTFSLLVAVTVIPTLYSLFNAERRMLTGKQLCPAQPEPAADTVAAEAAPDVNADADAVVEADAVETGEARAPDNDAVPAEKPVTRPKRGLMAALKEPRVMNGITSFYHKMLPKALGHKLVTLLVALAVFGGSIGMLFITGTEFLPSIDKGQIEVDMTYNSGVELSAIQADASAFAEKIREEVDNIDYVSVSVGKNGLLALTDTGIITVQLTTNRNTYKVVNRIRELAEAHKAAGTVVSGTTVREIDGVVASLMSGADDLSVTIIGSDADTLREITDKIKTRLEDPSTGFKDVKTSATDLATQYTLRFDRRRMAELGIDYQTTVVTLRIGIASYTACSVTIAGDEYNIAVQFEDDAIVTREDLENFVVGADADDGTKAVKLKDILQPVLGADGDPIVDEKGEQVKVLVEKQEACIRRTNGKEMISVSATLPGVDTGAAGKKLKQIAASVVSEYNDYKFEESGITSYLNDAFSGLVVALIVSFALLYGVMAIQFGSALKPLIVMSSIPFSFTGGFLSLVMTGTTLNVVSFIGLIMLMGVVVNNAIVMLEKIKQLYDDGMDHYDAVREGCKVRLRPIFMTTLTTILALIPLAIGVGQGSELMQPLGIVVMGGLLLGTVVTLVIVPTLYCAVYRLSAKFPNGKKKAA